MIRPRNRVHMAPHPAVAPRAVRVPVALRVGLKRVYRQIVRAVLHPRKSLWRNSRRSISDKFQSGRFSRHGDLHPLAEIRRDALRTIHEHRRRIDTPRKIPCPHHPLIPGRRGRAHVRVHAAVVPYSGRIGQDVSACIRILRCRQEVLGFPIRIFSNGIVHHHGLGRIAPRIRTRARAGPAPK